MIQKHRGLFLGCKFFAKDGAILLACGDIENEDERLNE